MKTREIPERQRRQAEQALCRAVLELETVDEVRDFLRDLCTPAELQAMADRWAVVAPIERGVPYREIHDRTGVSVTTIARVARFLQSGSGGYRRALDRLQSRKA